MNNNETEKEITIMNDKELHQAKLLGQGIIDHELQIINKNNRFQMGYEIDTLPTESVDDFDDIKKWTNTAKSVENAKAPKGIYNYFTGIYKRYNLPPQMEEVTQETLKEGWKADLKEENETLAKTIENIDTEIKETSNAISHAATKEKKELYEQSIKNMQITKENKQLRQKIIANRLDKENKNYNENKELLRIYYRIGQIRKAQQGIYDYQLDHKTLELNPELKGDMRDLIKEAAKVQIRKYEDMLYNEASIKPWTLDKIEIYENEIEPVQNPNAEKAPSKVNYREILKRNTDEITRTAVDAFERALNVTPAIKNEESVHEYMRRIWKNAKDFAEVRARGMKEEKEKELLNKFNYFAKTDEIGQLEAMRDNEFNKLKAEAEREAKEAQEAAKAKKEEEETLQAAKEKREKQGKAIQKQREAFIETLGEKDNAAQKLIENFSKEKELLAKAAYQPMTPEQEKQYLVIEKGILNKRVVPGISRIHGLEPDRGYSRTAIAELRGYDQMINVIKNSHITEKEWKEKAGKKPVQFLKDANEKSLNAIKKDIAYPMLQWEYFSEYKERLEKQAQKENPNIQQKENERDQAYIRRLKKELPVPEEITFTQAANESNAAYVERMNGYLAALQKHNRDMERMTSVHHVQKLTREMQELYPKLSPEKVRESVERVIPINEASIYEIDVDHNKLENWEEKRKANEEAKRNIPEEARNTSQETVMTQGKKADEEEILQDIAIDPTKVEKAVRYGMAMRVDPEKAMEARVNEERMTVNLQTPFIRTLYNDSIFMEKEGLPALLQNAKEAYEDEKNPTKNQVSTNEKLAEKYHLNYKDIVRNSPDNMPHTVAEAMYQEAGKQQEHRRKIIRLIENQKREDIPKSLLKDLQKEQRRFERIAYHFSTPKEMAQYKNIEKEIQDRTMAPGLSRIYGLYPDKGYSQTAQAELDGYQRIIKAIENETRTEKQWNDAAYQLDYSYVNLDEKVREVKDAVQKEQDALKREILYAKGEKESLEDYKTSLERLARKDHPEIKQNEKETTFDYTVRLKKSLPLNKKISFVMEEGENVSDYVTRINSYLKTIQKNLIETRENYRTKNVERLTAQMKALNKDQPMGKIKEKVEQIIPSFDAKDTIYEMKDTTQKIKNWQAEKEKNETLKIGIVNRQNSKVKPHYDQNIAYEEYIMGKGTPEEFERKMDALVKAGIYIKRPDMTKVSTKEQKPTAKEWGTAKYHEAGELAKFNSDREEKLSYTITLQDEIGKVKEDGDTHMFDTTTPEAAMDNRNGQSIKSEGVGDIDTDKNAEKAMKVAAIGINEKEQAEIIKAYNDRDAILSKLKAAESKRNNLEKAAKSSYDYIESAIEKVNAGAASPMAIARAKRFTEENTNPSIRKHRDQLLNALRTIRIQYKGKEDQIPTEEDWERANLAKGKKEKTKDEENSTRIVKEFPMTEKTYKEALHIQEMYEETRKTIYTLKWVNLMEKNNNDRRQEYNRIVAILKDEDGNKKERVAETMRNTDRRIKEREEQTLTRYQGRYVSGKELEDIKKDPEKAKGLFLQSADVLCPSDEKLDAIRRRIEITSQKVEENKKQLPGLYEQIQTERNNINNDLEKVKKLDYANLAENRVVEACIPQVYERVKQKFNTKQRDIEEKDAVQQTLLHITEIAKEIEAKSLISGLSNETRNKRNGREGKQTLITDIIVDRAIEKTADWFDKETYQGQPNKKEIAEIKKIRAFEVTLGNQPNTDIYKSKVEQLTDLMNEDKHKINARLFTANLKKLENFEKTARGICEEANALHTSTPEEKQQRLDTYEKNLQTQNEKIRKEQETLIKDTREEKEGIFTETMTTKEKVAVILNHNKAREETNKRLGIKEPQDTNIKKIAELETKIKDQEKKMSFARCMILESEHQFDQGQTISCMGEEQLREKINKDIKKNLYQMAGCRSESNKEKKEKLEELERQGGKGDYRLKDYEKSMIQVMKTELMSKGRNYELSLNKLSLEDQKKAMVDYGKKNNCENSTYLKHMLSSTQGNEVSRITQIVDTVINKSEKEFASAVKTYEKNWEIEEDNAVNVAPENRRTVERNQMIIDSLKQSDPEIKKAVETIQRTSEKAIGKEMEASSTAEVRMQKAAAKEYMDAIGTISEKLKEKGTDLIREDVKRIGLTEALKLGTVKEMKEPKPYQDITPGKAAEMFDNYKAEKELNPQLTPEGFYKNAELQMYKSTLVDSNLKRMESFGKSHFEMNETWKERFQDYTEERIDELRDMQKYTKMQSLDKAFEKNNVNSNDTNTAETQMNRKKMASFENNFIEDYGDVSDNILKRRTKNQERTACESIKDMMAQMSDEEKKAAEILMGSGFETERSKTARYFEKPIAEITEDQMEKYSRIEETTKKHFKVMLRDKGFIETEIEEEKEEESKALESLNKGKSPEKTATEVIERGSAYAKKPKEIKVAEAKEMKEEKQKKSQGNEL